MTFRDAAIITGFALLVSVPLSLARVRAERTDEARAFGRGAIAGLCLAIKSDLDAHQPTDRAQDVMRDCKPYLAELTRRTGGAY